VHTPPAGPSIGSGAAGASVVTGPEAEAGRPVDVLLVTRPSLGERYPLQPRWEEAVAGKKNSRLSLLRSRLILQMMILPRQARDKHGENSAKKRVTRFLAAMRGAGLVVETTTTMKVAPTASNTGGAGKGEEESALVLQLRRAKVVLSESSSRRYMPPEWCEKRLLLEPVLINVYQTFIKTIVSPRQARDKQRKR
jgi:hypothetical protein